MTKIRGGTDKHVRIRRTTTTGPVEIKDSTRTLLTSVNNLEKLVEIEKVPGKM